MSDDQAPNLPTDAVIVLDALRRFEQRLEALTTEQAAMAQQIRELRADVHHVGYLVQLQSRGVFASLELPLPLARLRDLVVSPRQSLAFLCDLERRVAVTSTRLHRSSSGEWRAGRNGIAYAAGLSRRIRELMFGSRRLIYRVEPRHAPAAARPRILHVIPNVFVGGSTQLVVDLHEHLGHRYDMQVLTAALPPGGRHEGLTIHHLPHGTQASAFEALMASVRPDLVHVHYWGDVDRPWYVAAIGPALASGTPVIENVNTPVEPFLEDRIARYVFVSDYVRQTFAPDLRPAEVVYPGIDLSRFRPPASWDADALDSLGMVYRLHPDKLAVDALDPMIAVAQRRPRTRIIVIGDGDLLMPFHGRVVAGGVARNFEFAGTLPYAALPQAYARFRTFVAPVARESFGQVTPFAMAMGQAVAGNRIGALPEILGSDETLGRTVEETADILVSLLDDPERIMALGERNRTRAQKFAVETMIASYARIYAEATGTDANRMPGFKPAEIFAEV